ncbi:MAG: NAD(P)H-dependent oxidoreductase subunit E [Deltaproteobacteria bacterium]|nr:NAD(P)H-dependent oxidoreductase subunit E [Deltaproteobacteria bacterium]
MELEKIDRIIDEHEGKERSLILILMELQHENHWLPKEALERVAERLAVPLARVQQIASFYKTFSLVPKGHHQIHVCTGTSCHLRGAQKVLDSIEEALGIKPGETAPDMKFSVETVNCIGACALGPVMEIDGVHHGKMAPSKTADVLKSVE